MILRWETLVKLVIDIIILTLSNSSENKVRINSEPGEVFSRISLRHRLAHIVPCSLTESEDLIDVLNVALFLISVVTHQNTFSRIGRDESVEKE